MWHLTMHRWVGEPREAIESSLADHLAWMHEQQTAGRILMAGPTPDRSMGIMVFGHLERDDVDAICATDPFVARGFRTYEVIPWDVHHVLGIGGFTPEAVSAPERDSPG